MGGWLAQELDEAAQRRAIRDLSQKAGIDLGELCRSLAMNWDELCRLNEEPLVMIGSHTVGHYAAKCLSADEARAQILDDVARQEAELGARGRSFSPIPMAGRIQRMRAISTWSPISASSWR
ncbi:hypothetical protein [Breoghania sp.]|uniref:hypothetical protein n=1 Tax=Breoghania sp. TaxID=2065378 RepID=UPI00261E795E|nr:hypothetical protein [Breoghania sp.]MDJ0929567.1 hypothetical protein [Breoghania sp.]